MPLASVCADSTETTQPEAKAVPTVTPAPSPAVKSAPVPVQATVKATPVAPPTQPVSKPTQSAKPIVKASLTPPAKPVVKSVPAAPPVRHITKSVPAAPPPKPIVKAVAKPAPAPLVKPVVKTVPVVPPTTPPIIPDYGGRDGVVAPTADLPGQSLDPMGQALRAFEALVIVLVGVVGVVYLIKRFGGVNASGKLIGMTGVFGNLSSQMRSPHVAQSGSGEFAIQILNSMPLPGGQGTVLHVVSVAGRTLVLGATPQSVNLITEWAGDQRAPHPETAAEKAAFNDYLERAGIAETSREYTMQADEMEDRFATATDRLQAILAKSREDNSAGSWRSEKSS